jgi:hypothetical protein
MDHSMNRGVTFEAEGQTYLLRFDTRALCQIEADTQMGIGEAALILSPVTGSTKITDLRMFLSAGLGSVYPIDVINGIMDDLGVVPTAQLVGRAFEMAFPDIDATAEGDVGKTKGRRD